MLPYRAAVSSACRTAGAGGWVCGGLGFLRNKAAQQMGLDRAWGISIDTAAARIGTEMGESRGVEEGGGGQR